MRTHGGETNSSSPPKRVPQSMQIHGTPPPNPAKTKTSDGPTHNLKVHVADVDTYEVLWPQEAEARARLATAVPSQFAKSTRRKEKKLPVGFSTLAEEPEDGNEELPAPPRPARKPNRSGLGSESGADEPPPPMPNRKTKPTA
jgi:hypothetical protein